MEIEKLVQPAPDWSGGTWANRVDQCASVLFLHGYITPRQRESIAHRMEKQFEKGLATGRIVKKENPDV